MKITFLKFGSFSVSILIHALILIALLATVVKTTLPEGNVSTVEFETAGGGLEIAEERPSPQPPVETVTQAEAPQESVPVETPPEPVQKLPPLKTPVAAIPTKQPAPQQSAVTESSPEGVPTPLGDEGDEQNSAEESGSDQTAAAKLPLPATTESSGQSSGSESGSTPPAGAPGTGGDSQGVRSSTQIREMPGNQPPRYTTMTRLKRLEGTVVLRYRVTPEGETQNVKVEKSSGHEELDEIALQAEQKYRYQPNQEGEVRKVIVFRLQGRTQFLQKSEE